jgi:hypothetical protein
MNYTTRRAIYRKIEQARQTKVIAFVTSDRSGMETQIASDCIDLFVDLLDKIGPTPKISLILHTNGGNTAAAWRLVNLIRTFADELEVLIPLKALSAGTLISLGADKIVMTKQGALGPIDPSITHPLGPTLHTGNQLARVPVSVEAVRGYIDAAREDLDIKNPSDLASILINLSGHIHPLVIGEIFRSRAQIRFLAEKLIRRQVKDSEKIQSIIDFLCADSGSHDYTVNRREAAALGLNVEKPTDEFYDLLKKIHASYTSELKLLQPYAPQSSVPQNGKLPYTEVRGLVESAGGGSYGFISEGELSKTVIAPNGVPQELLSDQRTFEGWRKMK